MFCRHFYVRAASIQNINISTCVYVLVYTYAHIFICVYVQAYIYVHLYVCDAFTYVPTDFPACIHDCKTAVRFLRKSHDTLGIHPDRIGVIGSSAGYYFFFFFFSFFDYVFYLGQESH